MNRSTCGTCWRISSRARARYGSISPSRNSSSPWSVQQTGRPNASASGRARPISIELVRLTMSGAGSPAVHSSSLSNSFAKDAVGALEHRDREVAEQPRIGRDRPIGERLMTRGESSSRSRNRGILRKSGELLLEVDADAAKQHLGPAHVRLVGQQRGVEGQQRHVVAARDQLGGQRVVAKAAAAIHPAGPRGDGEDLHLANKSQVREAQVHRVLRFETRALQRAFIRGAV